jgi:hypothetical protein
LTWERAKGGRWAETLRLNTTLASLDLSWNGLEEGGGRALEEALRLNTTLASLDLENTTQGEGGGRALAKALRLNTTITWINLYHNDLGEGGGRALRHCESTPRSRCSTSREWPRSGTSVRGKERERARASKSIIRNCSIRGL